MRHEIDKDTVTRVVATDDDDFRVTAERYYASDDVHMLDVFTTHGSYTVHGVGEVLDFVNAIKKAMEV